MTFIRYFLKFITHSIIMKLVILAAGKGIRMLPLTEERPKPLIEIAGRPFLHYVLEQAEKAGFSFNDIAIVVGYKKEMIKKWLVDNNVKITTIEQDQLLGTGHAISLAQPFVDNENFIVLMGDNLYLAQDVEKMEKDDDFCYIAGFKHNNPEKFGVLITERDEQDNMFLVKIEEKPEKPPSDLINTGLYKLTPEVFDALKRIKKNEKRHELEITDALNMLARRKKVRIIEIKTWYDFGCPDNIKEIEEFVRKNTAL